MPQVFSFLKPFFVAQVIYIGIFWGASAMAASDHQLPAWKALHYRLSLLFVSAQADISIGIVDKATLQRELLDPPKMKALPPAKQVYQIRVTTDNLGRRSDSKLWYNPDFRMLQMTRFDSGKQHRKKVFRYMESGFWSTQRSPMNDKEVENVSSWSKVENKTVRKPPALYSQAVIEDSLLFHMVSVLPLRKKGDSYDYYSYINDAVFHNQLQVVGLRSVEVDYVEKHGQRDHWREGEVELLELRVRPQAMEQSQQEDFEIMGLKGDLSLYVEPKTGVLVRLSGDVDYLGRVDIDLYQVDF